MSAASASLVIPFFRGIVHLPRAIECALGQTEAFREIVVVVDGSPEDTGPVERRFGSAVRWIHQQNAGPSAARNVGAAACSGAWLKFLDADDWIDPTLLRDQLAAAGEGGADVLVSGWDLVAEGDRVLLRVEPPRFALDPFHVLLARNTIAIHSALVRRESFERVGGFDASLRFHEDWDLWLRLAASGGAFRASAGGRAHYLDHPASSSKRPLAMFESRRLLLARHTGRHGACAACAAAARESIWVGRSSFVVDGLVRPWVRDPSLADLVRAGRSLADAWRTDPGLVPALAYGGARRLARLVRGRGQP